MNIYFLTFHIFKPSFYLFIYIHEIYVRVQIELARGEAKLKEFHEIASERKRSTESSRRSHKITLDITE